MDALIPPLSTPPSAAPDESGVPRWLPWLDFGAGLLCLLWIIPSWFMAAGMFADLPIEARPPPVVTYLLTAIPAVTGLALVLAGACFARRGHYVLCAVVSVATLLGGPVMIVGVLNLVQLNRPQVKAAFLARREREGTDVRLSRLSAADRSHLNWLALMYALMGILVLFGLFVPSGHIFGSIPVLLENTPAVGAHGEEIDIRKMAWLFLLGGLLFSTLLIFIGGALLRLAWHLVRMKHHARTVSLAKRFGPLGLMAEYVLMRPSVKAAFDANTPESC